MSPHQRIKESEGDLSGRRLKPVDESYEVRTSVWGINSSVGQSVNFVKRTQDVSSSGFDPNLGLKVPPSKENRVGEGEEKGVVSERDISDKITSTSTYHDSCTLFSRLKKENWGGKVADVVIQLESLLSQENINIKCPVPLQKMSIENVSLKLPTLSSTAALLVEADYKMKLTAIDRHTKKVNLCMSWEMSIKAH
ncbi:Hypothetical predicted protein [Octopus vulgaris]|uniref:Uncharacterized protein n=1 Tax=Octopus vulgaris TaxID=6645 RepID=A0AA36FLK9_OCTVU|nr:Hypothetical predicted protein [Octopus vulgaris]